MMRRWMVGFLVMAAPAAADELDRAVDEARREIASWLMTPKQDIAARSNLYVEADGSLQQRAQGRRDTRVRGDLEPCMRRGQSYQMLHGKKRRIWVKIRDKSSGLEVELANCVSVHVNLGRRPQQRDLEPRALAGYLSGLFELDGAPEITTLGRELAALERENPGGLAPAPARPSGPDGPPIARDTVIGLSVSATPARLRPGETVVLAMSYEVTAGATLDVRETWSLSFGGRTLPSYPNERAVARASGRHAPTSSQAIPSFADPGEYVFKGEVCAGDECISRVARFQVVRE